MKKAMTIGSSGSSVTHHRHILRARLLEKREGRLLPLILAVAIVVATSPTLTGYSFGADQSAAAAAQPGPAPGAATQKDLEELVSPIALYPDLLVARILVASTCPDQVVEAHTWLQRNSSLSRSAGRSGECARPGIPASSRWRSSLQFHER